MATQTLTCTKCGKDATVDLGDEELAAGVQIAWECPDFECSNKNFTEGRTPAEIALGAVGAPTDPDVVTVADTDVAQVGDIQS